MHVNPKQSEEDVAELLRLPHIYIGEEMFIDYISK